MAEFAKSIGQALTEITGGKSEKRSGSWPTQSAYERSGGLELSEEP